MALLELKVMCTVQVHTIQYMFSVIRKYQYQYCISTSTYVFICIALYSTNAYTYVPYIACIVPPATSYTSNILYRCLCICLQVKIYLVFMRLVALSRTYTQLHVVYVDNLLTGAPNRQSLVWSSGRQAFPHAIYVLVRIISLSLLQGQLPRIQA